MLTGRVPDGLQMLAGHAQGVVAGGLLDFDAALCHLSMLLGGGASVRKYPQAIRDRHLSSAGFRAPRVRSGFLSVRH